jgi:vancomycin resistance protein VanJ
MKPEITMTQMDTPESGKDGVSRWDTGPGTWRAGIRQAIRIGSRPGPWKRGPVLAALTLILALVMLLHAEISDWRWNLGSWPERCGAAPPPRWSRWCCRP